MKTGNYGRPFLYYCMRTHAIITVQGKAYSDQVALLMWGDLVLQPYAKRMGLENLLVVWDNAPVHVVSTVKAHLRLRCSTTTLELPPNTTDILQVNCCFGYDLVTDHKQQT